MSEPDWKAMGDPLNDRLPPKDSLLNRRRRKDLARIVGPRTLDEENVCTRCGAPDVHCQCDDEWVNPKTGHGADCGCISCHMSQEL